MAENFDEFFEINQEKGCWLGCLSAFIFEDLGEKDTKFSYKVARGSHKVRATQAVRFSVVK